MLIIENLYKYGNSEKKTHKLVFFWSHNTSTDAKLIPHDIDIYRLTQYLILREQ